MDTYAVSISWPLWILLLWTRVYIYLFKHLLSVLLSVCPGVALLGYMVGDSVWSFVEPPEGFPQWVNNLTFPLAVYEGFYFSTSSTKKNVFNYSCPSGCEMKLHCDFGLYFHYDWWCWESFPVLICHLYIFFGKIAIQVLCPLFNWVAYLLVVEL